MSIFLCILKTSLLLLLKISSLLSMMKNNFFVLFIDVICVHHLEGLVHTQVDDWLFACSSIKAHVVYELGLLKISAV